MAHLGVSTRLKRAIFGAPAVSPIDLELAAMEQVFHAPPLTPELVAAIKLIAPHFHITTDEKYRRAWQADQNAACWAEYLALAPILEALPSPKKTLEIGPGLGRSIVFLTKKLDWEGDDIHVYDGEGTTTKYTMAGPRFEDSFCGNFTELQHVLDYNDAGRITIHDASDGSVGSIPHRFDLIYAFYSVGFHWALDHFIDDIVALMNPGATAIFTLASEYEPPQSFGALTYEIVTAKSPLRKRDTIRLIVLRK